MNVNYVHFFVKLQLILLYIIRRAFIRYLIISICIYSSVFIVIVILRVQNEEEYNKYHPHQEVDLYEDESELRFGKSQKKVVDFTDEEDPPKHNRYRRISVRNAYDMRRRYEFDDDSSNVIDDDEPAFLKIKRKRHEVDPPIPRKDNTWQEVSDGYGVFSAFCDRRNASNPVIRVIAAASKATRPTWCRLWYKFSNEDKKEKWDFMYVKAIKLEENEEDTNYYTSVFLTCPMEQQVIPVYVSLMTSNEMWPHNILVVHNREEYKGPRQIPYNGEQVSSKKHILPAEYDKEGHITQEPTKAESVPMVLCVKLPVLANEKVMHLMEFLEFYLLLGVRHFFLYTPPLVHTETRCLLNNYTTNGTITILPWLASNMYRGDYVFEAPDSADNDCVYRAMSAYTYAVVVNMNEFIIPRTHWSLQQILKEQVSAVNKDSVTGFLFPMALFCVRWSDEKEFKQFHSDIVREALYTLAKTQRMKFLGNHKEYIVIPERVKTVHLGFYSAFSPQNDKLNVSSALANLHYYTDDSLTCNAAETIRDKSAYRYKQHLLISIWTRYKAITCPKVFKFDFFVRDHAARVGAKHSEAERSEEHK